jgi:hypothetical protein
MAWYLNPALSAFRTAVNAAYPDRDKGSDGTIGDEHHKPPSDHLEDGDGSVDAWDMDVEVNGKGKPYAADVEHLKKVFEQHEASRYWIHDRQIATRSNGWRRERYTGPNPHTLHVHWNTRESHEHSAQPWEVDMALTADDIAKIATAVWAHQHTNPVTKQPQTKGTVLQYMDGVHDAKEASILAAVRALAEQLNVTVDVDEEAIIAGVLAGLPPERIAAAIPPDIAQQVVDRLLDTIAAGRQQP